MNRALENMNPTVHVLDWTDLAAVHIFESGSSHFDVKKSSEPLFSTVKVLHLSVRYVFFLIILIPLY